jgi:hypothetical protein
VRQSCKALLEEHVKLLKLSNTVRTYRARIATALETTARYGCSQPRLTHRLCTYYTYYIASKSFSG